MGGPCGERVSDDSGETVVLRNELEMLNWWLVDIEAMS